MATSDERGVEGESGGVLHRSTQTHTHAQVQGAEEPPSFGWWCFASWLLQVAALKLLFEGSGF